ncbi:MAG TPA: glycosyltransferase family 25 protein [Streptosporangiaceae bacterium]|nr:glycosyltransferase family 25 protein [Streptosporangiaceae bacterium]
MHAYVINLARSPERRAHITAQLKDARIDWELVVAVDGRDLDMTDRQTIGAPAPSARNNESFLPGEVGCALSHLHVYRRILADGLDQALVLEDDVILRADLPTVLDALPEHLAGSEVALLNFDSVGTCQVSRRGSANLPAARQLVHPLDIHQPLSAAAYVITRETCQRMTESRLPIRSAADDWGYFYSEGVLDRLRCVVPPAVDKTPDFESTMAYHSEKSIKGRVLSLITRHDLRLLQRAVVYRRERIWRRHLRVEFVDERPTPHPPRLARPAPPPG